MQAASTPELARAEGLKIAQEMLSASIGMVQGVQVSAPFGRYSLAAEVIAEVLPRGEEVANALPQETRNSTAVEGAAVGNI